MILLAQIRAALEVLDVVLCHLPQRQIPLSEASADVGRVPDHRAHVERLAARAEVRAFLDDDRLSLALAVGFDLEQKPLAAGDHPIAGLQLDAKLAILYLDHLQKRHPLQLLGAVDDAGPPVEHLGSRPDYQVRPTAHGCFLGGIGGPIRRHLHLQRHAAITHDQCVGTHPPGSKAAAF